MWPELTPMAVHYSCHVSPSVSRLPVYCTLTGGSSCDVIRTFKIILSIISIKNKNRNENYKIIIGEYLSYN